MHNDSILICSDENNYVVLSDLVFMDRQNIQWKSVEDYVKNYVGCSEKVRATSDIIYIGSDFPSEFKGSEDTKRLKGTNAKAKANSVTQLLGLIKHASNKRWQENYKSKHSVNAEKGWYRFTARFAFPIYNEQKQIIRYNLYRIELLTRCSADEKLYLYDMVNIKKEGEKVGLEKEGIEEQRKKEVDTPLKQNALR